jgi:hypothetical protein
MFVLAGLLDSPLSASAQEAIREPSKPASDLDWDEWLDLQWLLQVDQRVEPGLLVQELGPPAPPSEGSWLRLEVDFAGLRVVPRPPPPPPRPPREVPEYNRRQRIGVAVGITLGVALGVAMGVGFAFSRGGLGGFEM